MTGVVHRAQVFTNPAGGERFVNLARRFLLPAAALTALLLGLVLLIYPSAIVGNYTAFALFAIGLGALAFFTSFNEWRSPTRLSAKARPAIDGTSTSLPTGPLTEVEGRIPGRPRSAIAERGSEWRVLSAPLDPGDETWLSWLPRERRRLGSERDGLVPGVVHSPGKAGNLVAFPVRNYPGSVRPGMGSPRPIDSVPVAKPRPNTAEQAGQPHFSPIPGVTGHEPSHPSRRVAPFSEEELDRMFPPVSGRRRIFLVEAPQKVGEVEFRAREPNPPAEPLARSEESEESAESNEGPLSLLEGDTDRSSRVDRRGEEQSDAARIPSPDRAPSDPVPRPDPRASELFSEAANPVPPHLRGTGPLVRGDIPRAAHRSRESASPRSVCASCSKVVVSLRMSGPCPKCLRPVCNDCLREAFVTKGHGWCIDCSSAPPLVNEN